MKDNVREFVTCPKCKDAELIFREISEGVETFKQTADGTIMETGETGVLMGSVLRVEAVCQNEACKHVWTVRRIANITELPNWPKDGEDEQQGKQPEAAPETNTGETAEVKAEEKAEEIQPEVAPAAEPTAEPVAQTGKGKRGKRGKAQKAA